MSNSCGFCKRDVRRDDLEAPGQMVARAPLYITITNKDYARSFGKRHCLRRIMLHGFTRYLLGGIPRLILMMPGHLLV